MSHVPEQAREDFEKPFLRARRTLRHLFHIYRGDKSFNPNECDGCKEIHQFLTDPGYRGDENFPVGESIDPDWRLGPDQMEMPVKNSAVEVERARQQKS